MNKEDEFDAIEEQLQKMSERLETDVAAAVRNVLEKSGYFEPASLDKLVYPIAGWACGLPYEAHERGYVVIKSVKS